jgi:glycosyltransferase involved in cell wall biosynthesis
MALTSELDLDNAVDFVGWVGPDEVAGLINTATIVVVPSRGWEALPLVALEAAFMERPVVAAKDAGLPEVVVHRETGLLVDKEDSAGLAEAMAYLIE